MIRKIFKSLVFLPVLALANESKLSLPSALPYPEGWPKLSVDSCKSLAGKYNFSELNAGYGITAEMILYKTLPLKKSAEVLKIGMSESGRFSFYVDDNDSWFFWFSSEYECISGAWTNYDHKSGGGDGNPIEHWYKTYIYKADDGSLVFFVSSYSVQNIWIFFKDKSLLNRWYMLHSI